MDTPTSLARCLASLVLSFGAGLAACESKATDDASADATTDSATSDSAIDATGDDAPDDASDDGAVTVAAATAEATIARDFALLADGGELDLDASTHLAVTVRPDGSRTIVVTTGGKELWRTEETAAGDWVTTVDGDHDGRADQEETFATTATTITDTRLFDRGFDGAMDDEETVVTDLTASPPTRHFTASRLVAGGAPVVLADRTDADPDFQAAECPRYPDPPPASPPVVDTSQGQHCYPQESGPQSWADAQRIGVVPVVGAPSGANVAILVAGGEPQCTGFQPAQIQAAFAHVWQGLTLIRAIDSQRYLRILDGLRRYDVLIGCGIPNCTADPAAATSPVGVYAGQPRFRTMWLVKHLDRDWQLAELITHELLHVAAYSHVGGETGDYGRDEVYACARYATQCMAWDGYAEGSRYYGGAAPPRTASDAMKRGWQDSTRDAVRCADDDHKPSFGWRVAMVPSFDPIGAPDSYSCAVAVVTDPSGTEQLASATCCADPDCCASSPCTPANQETPAPAVCCLRQSIRYCDFTTVPLGKWVLGMSDYEVCDATCPADAPVPGVSCAEVVPPPTVDDPADNSGATDPIPDWQPGDFGCPRVTTLKGTPLEHTCRY